MENKYDFQVSCQAYQDDDEWELECNLIPTSERSKEEFGKKQLAYISLNRDPIVIHALQKKYGKEVIPSSTAILSFIQRYTENDPKHRLKGVGIVLLCSLLKHMYKRLKVTHIFLIATTTPENTPRLISMYRKFGFEGIKGKNDKNMVGNMKDIVGGCRKFRGGRNLPILVKSTEDSAIQEVIADLDTSMAPM